MIDWELNRAHFHNNPQKNNPIEIISDGFFFPTISFELVW